MSGSYPYDSEMAQCDKTEESKWNRCYHIARLLLTVCVRYVIRIFKSCLYQLTSKN